MQKTKKKKKKNEIRKRDEQHIDNWQKDRIISSFIDETRRPLAVQCCRHRSFGTFGQELCNGTATV